MDRSVWYYCSEGAVFSDLAATDRVSAVLSMVRIIMEGKGYTRDEVESMARSILCVRSSVRRG